MSRRIHIAALLLICLTPAAARAARLHYILAANGDDPQVGSSCQSNTAQIQGMIMPNVPFEQFGEIRFGRAELSATVLMQKLREIVAAVEPDDTILFFYAGGGFHERGEHYLAPSPGEKIPRSDIRTIFRDAIDAGKMRFAAIITDTCVKLGDTPTGSRVGAPLMRRSEPAPLLRRLFFETAGVVDVNSCQPGERAIASPDVSRGGLFSGVLAEYVARHREVDCITWPMLLDDVAAETNRDFAAMYPAGIPAISADDGKPQMRQSPHVFALINTLEPDARPPSPKPVTVRRFVTSVDPRSGVMSDTEVRETWHPTRRTEYGPTKENGNAFVVADPKTGKQYFRVYRRLNTGARYELTAVADD